MENKEINREFGLTSMSVKNRTTVFVITFIILVLGIGAYQQMPKEAFPEIVMPTIFVGTAYPGNSPLDIENLVTRVIEKEINTISGIDEIKSTSAQDFSQIIIQFETDVPAKDALAEVKDAIDKIKKDLPTDLPADPDVFELNFSEFPILNINLSGDFSIEKLNEYGEYLEDEIEELGEISKVEIRGVQDKEVTIELDLPKMEALELTFRDIEGAIANENLTVSGGTILSNGIRRTVRVTGEFTDYRDLGDVVVKSEKQNLVYLKEIADIDFTYEESESYARSELKPVVMLDVIKASGENLITASDKINEILAKAKEEVFPHNLEISITNDLSNQTRSQVANLENSIISGVILVVFVLLFFLGLRNALFVGVAIPLSMLVSFVILNMMGYTINMMVLFGLIMALGMLVDNGIVVVENIYRLMSQGYKPLRAAREGAGEVAWPIIASTATTLAAFLPLALWPGIMGEFMKFLPITLIVVLSSSLFVALVINPVLTAVFMKVDDSSKGSSKKFWIIVLALILIGAFLLVSGIMALGNILIFFGLISIINLFILTPAADKFQATVLPWMEDKYEKGLKRALSGRMPVIILVGTFLLLITSFVLVGIMQPKVLFFPENDPKFVNVFIELPIGTDIDETDSFTKLIEQKVMDIIAPYDTEEVNIIESVIAQVGLGAADPNDPSSAGGGSTPNKSRIQINFVESEYRDTTNTIDILKKIRREIGSFPDVTIVVDKDAAGPPQGKPISIEVRGLEYEKLIDISENVTRLINNSDIEGIEGMQSDLSNGKAEMLLEIDRAKAQRVGLSTGQIAMELRTSIFGKEVSKYKQGEDEYPMVIRLHDQYRYDADALMNKNIIYRDMLTGQMRNIPISAVATSINKSTIGSVKRKDLDRVITLFSNVLIDEGYNATDVNNELKDLIASAELDLPDGYEVKFTGQQEKQAEEMEFLGGALMMAVFLIFLIIVSQFNKISAPVIIISSVVLSTIGVLLGLIIFNMEFVIMMTMLGIISLAGIVVNNAIVLIDYTDLTKNRFFKAKEDNAFITVDEIKSSIIEAGKTRLRPVLLTAITTVLGLLPMAVGLNIDFFGLFTSYSPNIWMGGDNMMYWGPMSWTIIFGITFATFLTLILVPVMYLIVDKIKLSVGRAVVDVEE